MAQAAAGLKAGDRVLAPQGETVTGFTPHTVTEEDVAANPELVVAGHLAVGDEIVIPDEGEESDVSAGRIRRPICGR